MPPAPDPSNIRTVPRVAITMGDATGIGPEIVVKALSDSGLTDGLEPVVVGDLRLLRATSGLLDAPVRFVSDRTYQTKNVVKVVDLQNLPNEVIPGRESDAAGRASGEYIEKAVELWREGEIDAIATAPINKRAFQLGGYDFPGHTEFLAALSGTKKFAMSFFAGDLRVVLLTTHLSLRAAIDAVKAGLVAELIEFADAEFSRLLSKRVKLAVAGLNPHASEGGLFGHEERNEIFPAVEKCRSKGIDVSGPYSPDTIFLRAFRGEFDAVVACYHDQATIPVKAFSFGSAVNVTLGLPFIRTSVDHGTAFDIAGQGIADASSMTAAIKLAADLAKRSRRERTEIATF